MSIFLKSKKFIKRKEDFICDNCSCNVIGNGYTNHCPKCLWSKHVDIMPGDRMSDCLGMMEPIDSESKKDEFYVVLECKKCGLKKRNKLAKKDNINILINLKKDINDK